MIGYGYGYGVNLGALLNQTPDIIFDGNTIWFDSEDTDSMTIADGKVSEWRDKFLSGIDLLADEGNEPTLTDDGVDFVNKYMLTGAKQLYQPFCAFIAIQLNVWNSNAVIMDGNASISTRLRMVGVSPNISISSATELPAVAAKIGEPMIIRAFFDGANSKVQVDENIASVGNAGPATPGGITVGCRPGTLDRRANITVDQILIRLIRDTIENDQLIYDMLKKKVA